jgi:predicted helicase
MPNNNVIADKADMTINDILSNIRKKALTEKEKGTDFERLMKMWFLTDPRYTMLDKVWLWDEFPARKELGGKDLGIDLVAHTEYGDYWAIQCKCYAEDATIDKGDVDSFVANASRSFTDPETFQTREFSDLIWISTSRKPWGPNAEAAIQGLIKRFTKVSLYELEKSPVNWNKLMEGLYGVDAQLSGKQPKNHQLVAMAKAYEHFVEKNNERGKLIMACGTGKTFTSLKIMEQITPENAFALFLVPSIALLGQTLNAWMADKQDAIKAICVCSDNTVSKKANDPDDDDATPRDLALPATTNPNGILRQLRSYEKDKCRIVIFSTYQSIDAVKEAVDKYGRELDLIICDEAHRTTGVVLKDKDESDFTKVHRNDFIRSKKRLYMTATPRLYSASVKVKAKQDENVDVLCSMDEAQWYGEEFHRLSFNDAVDQGLLADYKVLVLTVSENDIPVEIQTRIKTNYTNATDKDKIHELQFDDATKLIGCINGLSKRIKGDDGVTREQDPLMMRRAVAFCQTINPTKRNPTASSTQIAHYFENVCIQYKAILPEEENKNVANVKARHIDGSMDADTRNELVSWLKQDADDPNECRVLCNVRCLSEGVDVPALDAVLFLSPRNSEVEVVQSVGRVMRTFGRGTDHEKKYGYIIIPVIVPADMTPEKALDDNDRFRPVWTILNALRSHDDNFNAHVNKINLNKTRPAKIVVGGVPNGNYSIGMDNDGDGPVEVDNARVANQLEMLFGELQDGIYARLVEKVGDKMYWENWAKSVGVIAQKFIERISQLIHTNDNARTYFAGFVDGLHRNINDSIDEGQAIEMLAQHMITRPVFDALFKDYQFVKNNAVSRAMQGMLEILESEGMEMDLTVLDKFYTSVRNNVSGIDNLEAKQTIIKNLYEKFFKGAFPLTVEKLGIVYTPVECVDFILHSVEDILQEEFNTSITNPGVHILDPFTGTGTFITRLLQSGLIHREDMLRKYREEIHCNEIVLLAYYIADVNIEAVYHEMMHPTEYENYDGICLTDTFRLSEQTEQSTYSKLFPENSDQLQRQLHSPIRVIIGNPPYSSGQKSANDNAQNLKYPLLDSRIACTYALNTQAKNKNSLYNSYIKAFRWASDRISQIPEGGIVAFISDGEWIDGNAQDGMRKCLHDEFTSVYVLNLRGNAHTSGERRRKEGGNVFRDGSRSSIAITFLVKNPRRQGTSSIHYHDIGDYLTGEKKLQMMGKYRSLRNVPWLPIQPNDKHDWINQRDGAFDSLIPIESGKKFDTTSQTWFCLNSVGVGTRRDFWAYGSDRMSVANNMKSTIDFYNQQVLSFKAAEEDNPNINVDDFKSKDSTKISWSSSLIPKLQKGIMCYFDSDSIIQANYRPFFKQKLYFGELFIHRRGNWDKIFAHSDIDNEVICVSGVGVNKLFSCIITDAICDEEFIGKSQCFPLYYYEERNPKNQQTLFDLGTANQYERRDGITDWILKEIRGRYKAKNITKEMIFYYVYGLLHSPDYRKRFAAHLKKSLPRIPIVDDVNTFMDFYNAGKALANLHLNYEQVPPCSECMVTVADFVMSDNYTEYDHFQVTKMRFPSKVDKSTILYNGNVRIDNIPTKAYEYVVNGKSAIEWVMERYCIKQDPDSLIVNDANAWSREHHNPTYILDLLLSIINLSIQTVDIVNGLPKLIFD